jgi:hypothetical protein
MLHKKLYGSFVTQVYDNLYCQICVDDRRGARRIVADG